MRTKPKLRFTFGWISPGKTEGAPRRAPSR
jgi:hypothetical protein